MQIDKNEFRSKILIKHAREYGELIKRVKEYEDERFPGGWKEVQMSFLLEMADQLEHWIKQAKDAQN